MSLSRRCGWDRDFKSSNRGSSGRRPSDICPVSPQKRSSATYLIFNATTAKKTVGTCHRHSRGLCINLLDVRSANFEESVSSEPEDDSDDHNRTSRWPSPCRESLTIGPVRNWVRSSSNPPLVIGSPHLALLSGLLGSSNHHEASGMTEEMLEIVIYCCRRFASLMMESYNIAIIGADGVGKSSFVQRALDLACPPATNPSSARMAVDNVTHMVTLFELELEHFELDPCQPIQWPKEANGHIVPRLDAALVLYDVMSRNSIRELPQMVASLTDAGLPAILGACNCDHPEDDWDINADELAEQPFFKSFVNHFRISTHGADVSRACLYSVVRAAIMHKRDVNGDETVSRRRAQSAINLQVSDPNGGRRLSEHSRHSLASSDFSIQHGDDGAAEKPQIAGVAFKDLVDRLLAPPLSRVDNNFSDIFLCLYRKFAAPNELFSAIQVRLQKVQHDESANYLIKTATQLRIVEVVSKWVSSYPGDFARSGTKGNLEDFIRNLSKEPIFMFAAQQLRHNLQSDVIEDDDTGWANSDNSLEETGNNSLSEEMEELSAEVSSLQLDGESTMLPGGSDKSSMDRSSRMGSQFPFNTSEEYEREAMLLEPSDHLPMNKLRYHSFMDISDYDVADELTRIDWIMFSSIRIRDFVRHVSLSATQRNKCRSLQNVNRMINHFNHVAKWVANMILLRDKAKHRAQMLEKFMNIALRLRQLNNYNGLAAVLAGINGTAIHRLTQTRALVSAEVQKRFARLLLLMGTQKSHFAYRLAWENSPLPRIPFIPLHRRDLVTAEEGSKTIIGSNDDRINWKKFEVLGEILLPIMKSQGTAYPNLTKHNMARELILGCRMPMDDEEIYQRSIQVESSALVPIEPSKKKFPWFAI
ncbi:hypothetical protein E4U09_005478 [Claviceps aff. purpurea]|uniref:Aimless RasGEF (AleA) n=1 Tax=Claviceps aff. purpurea TaxID=1967640 RepID=A0A9P7QE81_9HYPO|nr:hypothetical protein E4U09_005478 [Claviceps aff. purpurea]